MFSRSYSLLRQRISTTSRHPGTAGSASAISPARKMTGSVGRSCRYFRITSGPSRSTSHTTSVPADHNALRIISDSLQQIPVAYADEVENRVEPQLRDLMAGALCHQWLGVERDTQAGGGEHGQIVGPVSDGDRLLQRDVFLGR